LRYHEQKDEAHGRREVHKIWLSDDVSLLRPNVREAWPTIGGTAMVKRCFYITGLRGASAESVAGYIRGHWAVENSLHWQLDVSFNEDQQRKSKDFASENHCRINRRILNLLTQDKSVKIGTEKTSD
jgi:hypothetical protein